MTRRMEPRGEGVVGVAGCGTPRGWQHGGGDDRFAVVRRPPGGDDGVIELDGERSITFAIPSVVAPSGDTISSRVRRRLVFLERYNDGALLIPPPPYFYRSIPPGETTRTISLRPRVRSMPLSASSCIPFFSSSNNKDMDARRDRSPSLSCASSPPSSAASGSEDRSSRAVLRLRPPPPPRLVPSSFLLDFRGAPP